MRKYSCITLPISLATILLLCSPISSLAQSQYKETLQGAESKAQDNNIEEAINSYFKVIESQIKTKQYNQLLQSYTQLWKLIGKYDQGGDYGYYITGKMDMIYQKYPHEKITRQQLINSYQKYKQPEKLLSLYRQDLLRKNPPLSQKKQAQLFRKIADIHLKTGYLQFAYDNYGRALKKNPEDIIAATRQGLVLIVSHEFKEAIKLLEDTLKKDLNNQELRLYLAYAYILNNQIDKSEGLVKGLSAKSRGTKLLNLLIQYQKKQPMNSLLELLLEK